MAWPSRPPKNHMAESTADFTLRLKNQVTGPARAMSKSIRGLSRDLRDKQKVFDQGETEFQKKLKASRKLADTAHRQELRAMRAKRAAMQRAAATEVRLAAAENKRRLGVQRDRLQDRFASVMRRRQMASRAAQQRDVGFQRGLVRQQAAARRARERARFLEGESRPGGGGVFSQGFVEAGKFAFIGAITAAAAGVAFLAAKFTSATVAAVDFAQRSKVALTSILKDGTLATQQFSQVRREAAGLGMDVTDAVDGFKMLANAGFKVPVARDLVRLGADLQALTGSSESAKFALRAISQIKMKGRLQAEEITGQLAEHGVSADAVYAELGKTLGKTRTEILKMQKAGEISADVAIPAILQAVRNQLGVEKSGGFAMKVNASSVGGMWRTLKGQVQNAFISLGEEVGPGITRAFSSIMASIQEAVASPQVAALGNAVVSLFNSVSELVGGTDFATLLKNGAESLGTEIRAAATFIRENGASLRESFTRFVVAMGTGLQMAVDFFKPFIAFANSSFGKFMFTPLNEQFGTSKSDAAIEASRAERTAAASRTGTAAAGQAGLAAGLGNKFGDIRFGDINVNLVTPGATPDGVGEQTVNEVRKQMMQLLNDI
jgi:tape measure domain-containing protein